MFSVAASSKIWSGLWDGRMSQVRGAGQCILWRWIHMQVAAWFSRRKIWFLQDYCKEAPESPLDHGMLLQCIARQIAWVEAKIIHMILGLAVACDRTAIGTANAEIRSSRLWVVPLQKQIGSIHHHHVQRATPRVVVRDLEGVPS